MTITSDGEAAPRFTDKFYATAAIACYSYSALALLIMHGLRPDYTVVDHMISDYAVGRFGWIMASCFVSMGVGCLMLLLGLARGGPTSLVSRLGTFLLAPPVIGLVISAYFTTDLETATVPTRSGQIHDMAFLVNILCIFFATVLLTVGFGSDTRWRAYQRTAVVLTALIVLAFVLQLLTMRRGAPYGVANRFFVAVLFTWILATAFRLRALAAA